MDTAPYHKPFDKSPSVLLVEHRDSTGSSTAMVWNDTNGPAPNDNEDRDEETALPITLGLAIRRTRLVLFTLVMVTVIGGLTLFFRHGVAVAHFDSRDKNATEQTKLLDDYNSYSGNLASVFAKPIELFVTVAVQVIVLRFMADTFTRPEMSWKSSAVTLLLGAGIGYMISNGFNALNVQLRPQAIDLVIARRDLRLLTNVTNDTGISSYNMTVPEARVGNPITNTMLKSAVTPKMFRGNTYCPWEEVDDSTGVNHVKEAVVNLGFMQREWQGRILQEAPPTTTLRVVVNPTNTSINDEVNSADLPMNASLAADLFYHAITISTSLFPWGPRHAFANRSDMARRYPVNTSEPQDFTDATTKVYGLLPSDEDEETGQRTWFLRESMAAMARQFAFAKRTKQSDLILKFSRAQITPTIVFDAVTFEIEIDPMLLATAATSNNATRYTVLDQLIHCPVPGRCMIPKAKYATSETLYDPPAQVFALGMCVDENENEVLRTSFTRENDTVIDDVLVCERMVGVDSMLTVSVAKRLEADSLEQNVSGSSNGTRRNDEAVLVTNLRKIYSFTVGRLSWQSTDLAETFHATCGAEEYGCYGLELELSSSLQSSSSQQRLIVGADDIPLDLLSTPNGPLVLAKTSLVLLDEIPPSPVAESSELFETLAGDVLLLHNIGNITWTPQATLLEGCSALVEDRIIQTLNNHMYMERGLQVAYTSAMYFVFMYGSVKDVIKVTASQTSLAFDGNSQAIAVWVSTPSQNMWLTLSGCFVLVTGLLAALLKATWSTRKDRDALANITEPQAIARVIVDERNYPPLFLHRRVAETDGHENVANYAIAGVSLQEQQQSQHQPRPKPLRGLSRMMSRETRK